MWQTLFKKKNPRINFSSSYFWIKLFFKMIFVSVKQTPINKHLFKKNLSLVQALILI